MPRVIVITGASAGVGRATAVAFARRGDAVALLARGRAGLDGAAAEVRAAGGTALAIPTDVADVGAVAAAAARVEAELGPIDVWVNNAMTAVLAEIEATTPAEFRRVMEVSYLGQVHGTLAALEHMRPRDRGTIVFVGSALTRRGIPLQASYCAAKHAVDGFFDSLRAELRHQDSKIHATIVQLPGLNTPQFGWVRARLAKHPQPVPPIFQPEVAARAIVWAASHRRRELWVGGPTYKTIIGATLVPGVVDWHLARTGYDGQASGRDIDPERADYLDGPVDAEHDVGTHGVFDDEAKGRSLALEATLNRGALAAGAGVAALAAAIAVARR